jgi:transposase-like protein
MTDHRKRYDGTFKAKVVLESMKNEKTIAELASEYGVHPTRSPYGENRPWRNSPLSSLRSRQRRRRYMKRNGMNS